MRRGSVSRAVVFAALAALASIPFALVFVPWLGPNDSLVAFGVSAAVGYVVVSAPSFRRGVRVACLLGALSALAAWLAPTTTVALVTIALALGLCRSAFLRPSTPGRALLVELLLIVGGLALAGVVAGPSLLGMALATWTFFLVQALFFAVGGGPGRERSERAGDPFEAARTRALRLLEAVE